MGVEGVDHVVERSGCRGLLGQVGGGAAGEHEHVDVVGMGGQLRGGPDGDVLAERMHGGRVAAGEHAHQFHIVVGGDGQFNAVAEIAIAENADADGVQWCLLGCSLSRKTELRADARFGLKLAGQAAPPGCRIIIAYRLTRGNLSMASVTRI